MWSCIALLAGCFAGVALIMVLLSAYFEDAPVVSTQRASAAIGAVAVLFGVVAYCMGTAADHGHMAAAAAAAASDVQRRQRHLE